MPRSSSSFVHTPLLVGLIAASAGFATAAGAGWPMWLCVSTAVVGLLLVALAFQGPAIARALRPIVGVRLGDKLERFLGESHQPPTRRRGIGAMLALLVASLAWTTVGGGQWALVLACIALGAMAFYWGKKMCPAGRPRSAAASFAISGYLLSLSANFLAGAVAGSRSLEASLASFHTKLDTFQDSSERNEQQQSHIIAKLDKIDAHLAASKLTGVDPTTQTVPPEIVEAAKSLIHSKSARERLAAAIVQNDWDKADVEIAQLLKSANLADTFDVKTLEGDRYYFAGRFDEAIAPYEAAFHLRPNDFAARNNLAIALTESKHGDTELQRRRAITIHKETLKFDGPSRSDKATIQYNLGNAWLTLSSGDRLANLRSAIDAFKSALEVFDSEAKRKLWAVTQSNLGAALARLPDGDRAANLQEAIAAYESALEVLTFETEPDDWAATQYNLGDARFDLRTGNRSENVQKAINAYELALKVYTIKAEPVYWAAIQYRLGNAWMEAPTNNCSQNVRNAAEAYNQALRIRTREAAPMQWAMAQNNLGNAWSVLAEQPDEDRCLQLRRAIACRKAALDVFTREASPRDHAGTSINLTINRRRYEELGCHTGPDGIAFDDIKPAE